MLFRRKLRHAHRVYFLAKSRQLAVVNDKTNS